MIPVEGSKMPHDNYLNRQQDTITIITKTIDQEFDDPAERMMLKLFLNSFGASEIACFAGVSQDTVEQVLAVGDRCLRRRLGHNLASLQAVCIQWKLGLI